MSRSYKHTSICGIATAPSEKLFKRMTAKAHRVSERSALSRGDDLLPLKREQPQWGPKDGKQYFDLKRWPEIMRK